MPAGSATLNTVVASHPPERKRRYRERNMQQLVESRAPSFLSNEELRLIVFCGNIELNLNGMSYFATHRWTSSVRYLPLAATVAGGRLPVACMTAPRNIGR